MKIAILQFPGSNCERETMLAVKRAGMTPVEFLWNEPHEELAHFDGYVIVGGFSYEDRSRAGIIAALDPLMNMLKKQSELGKPILGICNGAQILVESGLVPGVENNKVVMALTDNKRIKNTVVPRLVRGIQEMEASIPGSREQVAGRREDEIVLGTGYYNAWVNMRLSDNFQLNAFTRHLKPHQVLHVPVAHGEGRFIIPPALLTEMQENGLNVFQYCDEQGNIINDFPINPNGSIDNIAAVSNKAGNVMAMMPHPERTESGDPIFQSMRDYIAAKKFQPVLPLKYYPRTKEISKYQKTGNELVVDLIITDNQALSVENALQHAGIFAKIKRYMHWEIECDSKETLEKIKASGVLFNDRKELITKPQASMNTFLVRAKEDMIGQQKLQMLKNHFGVDGVHAIRHSTLWQVNGNEHSINEIINSHILYNPYAHDCYYY